MAHLFGDQDNPGDYDNGVWQHMCQIPRVPLQHNLTDQQIGLWCKSNNIDVLIVTMWDTYIGDCGGIKDLGGIEVLKEICPNMKIIGLVDHPLTVDLTTKFGSNYQNMKLIKSYTDALPLFDAVMVLTAKEYGFYKGFNPNTHYIGLPFPIEGMEKFTTDSIRPEKAPADIWVGLSVGGPAACRWDRNYQSTLETFKLAKKLIADRGRSNLAKSVRGIMLSWTEQTDRDIIRFIKENYEDVNLQMRSDMGTYLAFLQSCDVCLSNIVRDTPGRLVGECAHFGVPLIGSYTLDLQQHLFPKLSIDPYDICDGAELLAQLITQAADDGDMSEYTDPARDTLYKMSSYEATLKQFRSEVLPSIGVEGDWNTIEQDEKKMFI